MNNEKIFTPRRIIGIIFLILLYILNVLFNRIDNTSYNTYPEDSTEINEEYGKERDNFLETFINNLAENKYEEAYEMLAPSAKVDTFSTIDGFSKYFKDHIIDNNKVKKEVTYRWNNLTENNGVISNAYNVVLAINPEEFSKLNVTFDEILSFYNARTLEITVLEYNPYDYKIYMLKPNIPLTQKELEEYSYRD